MRVLKKCFSRHNLLFFLALIICMIGAFYFCTQKQGFHEDEYYSIYSTQRTTGFFVEDEKWMSREEIAQEYSVLPGQGFQYGLVKLVQSWDVHPQFYYYALHTAESLFPALLSKWQGLGVNLICYFLGLILFYALCCQVLRQLQLFEKETNIYNVAAVITFAYGCSTTAYSMLVLIRMYTMLLVFIYLITLLHVSSLHKEQLTLTRFYLPLAMITFFGFLTQYFYFIYLFFLAFSFCLLRLIRQKHFKEILYYGLTMVATFGVAYIVYPVYPAHMFHGQRGGNISDSLFDFGAYYEQVKFFGKILDKFTFSGLFFMLLIFAVVVLFWNAIEKWKKRKIEKESMGTTNDVLYMLLFTVICFFAVVAKVGLLMGDAALRYLIPMCPIAMLVTICLLLQNTIHTRFLRRITLALLMAWLILSVWDVASQKVMFLYPEDAWKVSFSRKMAEKKIPVAYAYDAPQTWCIWDSSNELLEYDQVYLFDMAKEELTKEPILAAAKQVMLYVSTVGDADACLKRVLKTYDQFNGCSLQWEDTFCRVYLLTEGEL